MRSAISVISEEPHMPSAPAKRRDCSPVPPQPNQDASPSVCCGLGQSPFLLYTHDKVDFISSALHRGSGAAHASAINITSDFWHLLAGWEIALSCMLNGVYDVASRAAGGCRCAVSSSLRATAWRNVTSVCQGVECWRVVWLARDERRCCRLQRHCV